MGCIANAFSQRESSLPVQCQRSALALIQNGEYLALLKKWNNGKCKATCVTSEDTLTPSLMTLVIIDEFQLVSMRINSSRVSTLK